MVSSEDHHSAVSIRVMRGILSAVLKGFLCNHVNPLSHILSKLQPADLPILQAPHDSVLAFAPITILRIAPHKSLRSNSSCQGLVDRLKGAHGRNSTELRCLNYAEVGDQAYREGSVADTFSVIFAGRSDIVKGRHCNDTWPSTDLKAMPSA